MSKPAVSPRLRTEKEGDVVMSSSEVDSSKLLADLRVKRANHEWLDRHRKELRAKFADKYVAVHKGAVVAANRDFPRLLSLLKKKFANTDPSLAAVEFMSEEEFVWVL